MSSKLKNEENNSKNNSSNKSQINSFKYSIAAFGSSFVVGLLHPFDIIKTRFQSHDGGINNKNNIVPKYNSIIHAVQQIYKDEGLKSFYKGFVWSLFAQSISRMLFFTLYEQSKNMYKEKSKSHTLSDRHIFYSSLQSGVFATIFTTPLWIVKTRMLLNTNHKISGFQNMIGAIGSIYRDHSIQGYWRGLSVSLPLCLHGVIQMQVFEKLMQFQKHIFEQNNNSINSIDQQQQNVQLIDDKIQASISGFMSKISAILITYPLQTLRTRLQQSQFHLEQRDANNQKVPKYNNVFDLSQKMVKHEGVRSFYKGSSASLIMNAPSHAIYFYCYEFFKHQLNLVDNRLD